MNKWLFAIITTIAILIPSIGSLVLGKNINIYLAVQSSLPIYFLNAMLIMSVGLLWMEKRADASLPQKPLFFLGILLILGFIATQISLLLIQHINSALIDYGVSEITVLFLSTTIHSWTLLLSLIVILLSLSLTQPKAFTKTRTFKSYTGGFVCTLSLAIFWGSLESFELSLAYFGHHLPQAISSFVEDISETRLNFTLSSFSISLLTAYILSKARPSTSLNLKTLLLVFMTALMSSLIGLFAGFSLSIQPTFQHSQILQLLLGCSIWLFTVIFCIILLMNFLLKNNIKKV